ncbi:hypothetical protein POM88_050273 [Heracleum sosnowskyi]|uniref:Uncharacterized protein n=1 Tax=Heracleum sosnowskyi TaxID=360622 RepID=A0AAD8M2E2_9APIA|nr:hypothetical protein POM88_050273 [Heracleum sosnowskyi]
MDERRNWDWHNMVDISPFLRYESTGDSDQVNCDLNMDHAEIKNSEADDAFSCCSDSYNNTTFNKNYVDHDEERAQSSKKKTKKKEESYAAFLKKKSKKKEQDLRYNPNCTDCNDDGDEDDGSINQVSSSCGNIGYVASSQHKKKSGKSNVLHGSSMEPKEDNDKLFWDTCLDN